MRVDTAGLVWAYRPQSHKTEHHGRERVIFIGPKGQEILRPYLLRDKGVYCFCPAEGERRRRDEDHARRKTPLHSGNRPGSNRQRRPQRFAGQRYTTASYGRAISRGCELAFGMPNQLRKELKDEAIDQRRARLKLAAEWRRHHVWHSNQLRHSAATEIRRQFGLEAEVGNQRPPPSALGCLAS